MLKVKYAVICSVWLMVVIAGIAGLRVGESSVAAKQEQYHRLSRAIDQKALIPNRFVELGLEPSGSDPLDVAWQRLGVVDNTASATLWTLLLVQAAMAMLVTALTLFMRPKVFDKPC